MRCRKPRTDHWLTMKAGHRSWNFRSLQSARVGVVGMIEGIDLKTSPHYRIDLGYEVWAAREAWVLCGQQTEREDFIHISCESPAGPHCTQRQGSQGGMARIPVSGDLSWNQISYFRNWRGMPLSFATRVCCTSEVMSGPRCCA